MSEVMDLVLKADAYQSNSPNAHRCPMHDEKLWAHKSGAALMCVFPRCEFHIGLQPYMVSDDEQVSE